MKYTSKDTENNDELTKQAKKYISDIRLFQYERKNLISGHGAMDLYFFNTCVSQEVMGMISIFEVILRNKIHNLLRPLNYLNEASKVLSEADYKHIKKTTRAIEKKGNAPAIIESRLITELTIGFWRYVVSNEKLWIQHLHKIFQKEIRKKYKIKSGEVAKAVHRIYLLRNKIAHHERIVYKRGVDLFKDMDLIILYTSLLIDSEDFHFAACIKKELSSRKENIVALINQH